MSRFATLLLVAILIAAPAWAAPQDGAVQATRRLTGTVRNALGRPVPEVELELRARDGRAVARTISNADGNFSFTGLSPGAYAIVTRKKDFKPATIVVTVNSPEQQVTMSIESKQPLTLEVTASRLNRARNDLSPETGGSRYHFSEQAIEQLPQGEDTSLRDVLTQAPGVTQDSVENGGFHVRNADGQVQYRINGIMLPDTGASFGDVFTPRFAQSISLLDGTLPSQFGYRTAGVIDIHTKSGCTNPGGNAEMYGGQRATFQPSVEYGGCEGKWDYYATGQYLRNERGVQPPTPGPQAIHDLMRQGHGFGYLSYVLNPATRVTLMGGVSVGNFDIPNTRNLSPQFALKGVSNYPSSALNESQLEQTYFSILALQGSIGAKLDYQVALFTRYFQGNFSPDPIGNLIFNGVASQVLNSSSANGTQGDFTYRWNPEHTLRAGLYFNEEGIEVDNTSAVFKTNPDGSQKSDVPFNVVENSNRLTFLGGLYVQDEWRPLDKLTLNYGLRWDIMDGLTRDNDLSPRIGAVYRLTPRTTLHAGYAHYFSPPPLELVTFKSIQAFNGTTNAVPNIGRQTARPERDSYFDAGVIQQFTNSFRTGVDSYFKLADQWLDNAQLGNSLVFSPQNYRSGRAWGVEVSNSYDVDELTAWANFTYSVAQVHYVSSMQFAFDPEELAYIDKHYIANDQAQLFTLTGGAAYRWRRWIFSLDSMWNSGLPGGFANLQTLPSYPQVNIGLTRDLHLPYLGNVQARASTVNLFDRVYLIRDGNGIDVNAASYGPRRAGYLGLTVPLPFGNASKSSAAP